jgi:Tol biopolymer transport system component/DNA-binding winged helix-turn-helix (wHTH) protein
MAGAFSVGDWHVDPSSRTLTGANGDVRLEPKVMQVLVLLAQHQGEVVTKETLLQNIWPDIFVGDEVLSRTVSELRRALGDDSKAPRYIQTIPKGGYKLIASVTSHEPAAAAVASSPGSGQEFRRRRRWRTPVLWGALILAGAGGAWLVARHGHGDSSLPPMAVRPLVTLPGLKGVPSFSPDGTRIAFAWRPKRADSRIVVKLVDDAPVQELTRGSYDANPAWSPDGRSIAFLRDLGLDGNGQRRRDLYVIPAIGGSERRVYSGLVCNGPTWAPDGRSIVFTALRPEYWRCSLYRLHLDTMDIVRLVGPDTFPEAGDENHPAFSPDGQTIAFVRDLMEEQDLYVIPSQGGAPKRLTFDRKVIWAPFVWTPDGMAIVYESDRSGSPELWRVPASGGQPERQSIAASATGGIALDREGRRLAYDVAGRTLRDIVAFDLGHPEAPPVRIAESSRTEVSASFSTDGKRIAFSSDRAGDGLDIWVADADGTHETRLTFSGGAGSNSPRWSLDGEWLAYDSVIDGQFDIVVIRASGGPPRRLTFNRSNEYGPSWSRNGRWLYFASDRTGSDQIYKMPSAGGVAVQITKSGGFPGDESADSRFLYYSKGRGQAGVWRVPIDGGLEEPVLTESPRGPYYRFWALVDDGIYYLNTQSYFLNPELASQFWRFTLDRGLAVETRPSVEFLRFSTNRTERILELPMSPCPDLSAELAISPNRRTLLTCDSDPANSEIFIVDNFR